MDTLITKLPSEVSNTLLSKIDEVAFDVNFNASVTAATRKIVVGLQTGTAELRLVGSAHFTNSSLSSDDGQTKTISAGSHDIYISNGKARFFIGSKNNVGTLMFTTTIASGFVSFANGSFEYGLLKTVTLQNIDLSLMQMKEIPAIAQSLNVNDSGITGNVDAFNKLTFFKCANCDVEGSTENIAAVTNVSVLELSGSKIEFDAADFDGVSTLTSVIAKNMKNQSVGDIDYFKSSLSLNTLFLGGTNGAGIVGSLDGLFDSLYSAGKVSGTLATNLVGTSATFNGNPITAGINVVFSAGGWTTT